MIVYPAENYNSFISESDADTYFDTRLYSEKYFSSADQEAALITAFRSLMELDITVDPTVSAQIQALKDAQCEQTLHEIRADLDLPPVTYDVADIKVRKSERPRYSPRAIAILRPYIKAPTVQVVR